MKDNEQNRIGESLLKEFRTVADPARAKKMSDYMKGHFPFFGISSPDRKSIQKQYHPQIKSCTIDEILDLSAWLWERPMRECQYAAIDMLVRHKKQLNDRHLPIVEKLITNKSWWDSVDPLASHLVGEILLNAHPDSLDTVDQYSKSANLWLIRTAIIHQLKYAEDTDVELLFVLVTDHCTNSNFFIRKASGWALRQASKFYPDAVRRYIFAHRHLLSRLTITEGSKYL